MWNNVGDDFSITYGTLNLDERITNILIAPIPQSEICINKLYLFQNRTSLYLIRLKMLHKIGQSFNETQSVHIFFSKYSQGEITLVLKCV